MDEATRRRIRDLVEAQERLLATGAVHPELADVLDGQYRPQHRELRALLVKDKKPCFCCWDSIQPWVFSPHPDLEAELDAMRAPLASILFAEAPAAWTLAIYRRGGNESDVPFLDEFALLLPDEKLAVLDESLKREVAVEGTGLLTSKAHPMKCKGGKHPQPAVLMYKIEEGAPSVRVVLRVFFDTAPGRTLVLLHGYDKGAGDSPSRERREADEACRRREDLHAQLQDPARRDAAVATHWE